MDNIINESEFINKVIIELNSIRTNPKAYSVKLKEYIKCFKGKVLNLHGTSIMTNEGASAFKEACEYLEKVRSINPLSLNKGLVNIASNYLKEIQQYEDLEEAREIDIQEIIDKYGYFTGEFRQSTDFGSSSAELIAINIIVDDGDGNREMRKILFTERIKEIGIATGLHPAYNYCTVLLFTSKFTMKSQEEVENEEQEDEEEQELEQEENEEEKVNNDEIDENDKEIKQDIKNISKKLKDQMNQKNKEEKKDFNQIKENKNGNVNDNDNDMDDEDLNLPENCIKMERNEKIITEKGIKKKVIKKIYYMEDGSTNIEVTKEALK